MISFKASDKSKFDLIRVRNPWGHGEWMLDWSDKPEDPDYNKLATYKTDLDKAYKEKRSLMERMGQEPVEPYEPGDDGDFLMNFEDFAKVYSNLFTGYSFDHKEYTCNYIREEWNKNYPSGICKAKGASEADRIGFVNKNHQYVMEIKEETDVLMMLSQQDGRLYRGEKYPYKEVCNGIIILVFTLEGERNLTKFDMDKMTLRRLKFELRREVDYWHRFKPGSYAIIPCKLKNKIEQSKFELRIYSEKNKSISLNKVKGPNNEFRRL
jgi:calpain